MTPFFKTYTGTTVAVALESDRVLFKGVIFPLSTNGGAITLSCNAPKGGTIPLPAAGLPIHLDGVDLSQLSILGDSLVLYVAGVQLT